MTAALILRLVLPALVALATASARGETPVSPTQVPCFQVHAEAWTRSEEGRARRPVPDDPFADTVWLHATAPDGTRRSVPAFYDGDDVWRARLMPDQVGPWHWAFSADAAPPGAAGPVAGPRGAFECVPNDDPKAHGGIRVDPDHPHHFRYQDATPCWLLGYECDWLFALDMNHPKEKPLAGFLDTLASNGFNYLVLQAYAHDTDWCPGRSGPYDVGPPALFAWEGSNEKPDHTRLNLAYWREYDRVIQALHARGITAQIMIKVFNKKVNWPAKAGPEDDRFWRYVVARYQAYNVAWNLSKEAWYDKDLPYWNGRIALIRAHDAHRRPIAVHDWNPPGMDADFLTDQQHDHWHEHILAERGRARRPVVNIEYGYEPGSLKTYNVTQPTDEVRRRTWLIAIAGGYPTYYFSPTAWDVIKWDEIPPGYAQMRVVRQVMESLPFADMEPHDELARGGWCLARPGEVYLVYQEKRGPLALTVTDGGKPGAFAAEWIDPRDGKRYPAPAVRAGEVRLTPPDALAADALLILRRP